MYSKNQFLLNFVGKKLFFFCSYSSSFNIKLSKTRTVDSVTNKIAGNIRIRFFYFLLLLLLVFSGPFYFTCHFSDECIRFSFFFALVCSIIVLFSFFFFWKIKNGKWTHLFMEVRNKQIRIVHRKSYFFL